MFKNFCKISRELINKQAPKSPHVAKQYAYRALNNNNGFIIRPHTTLPAKAVRIGSQ